MSVITQVQTVAERLTIQPDKHVARTPLITWPFLPKVQDPLTKQPEAPMKPPVRAPAVNRREHLLRSSSFVKLRQFCNQSCDALLFLRERRSALQTTVNHGLAQAKACALVLAVYLAVSVLGLQLGACLYLLTGKPAPPGLVFMLVSIVVITWTFSKIIVSFTKQNMTQHNKRTIHPSKKTN